MPQLTRLTAEQRADLVAYLDGELADDESRAIDDVLARSEVARHEVEAFSRTWDMLDVLPREGATADFTTKTMIRLRGQAEPRVEARQWVNPALIAFGWAAILASAGVIGFSVGHQWLPREDTPYVERLPLLENLDGYRSVGSLEFLERLDHTHLLPEYEGENP